MQIQRYRKRKTSFVTNGATLDWNRYFSSTEGLFAEKDFQNYLL